MAFVEFYLKAQYLSSIITTKTNYMKSMFKALPIVIILFIFAGCQETYKNPSKPIDERIEDLLSKMTLDEKILMLGGDSSGFDTKPIARLSIPAIHVTDGPVGVRNGKATSFPAAIAVAASWDTILNGELAKAMALETKAKGKNYLLGPCVCIQRMPISGRNFESYGEDPYLSSRLAVNWIKSLQAEKVISSVKHFAMNDQEWERFNYNVVADERTMREIHLLPFEAAVKEADTWSVMSAYNLVNGQHCSENFQLLTDILKKEWGFKGFVISDWTSVYSTVNATNAGLDLEMPKPVYFHPDSMNKYLKEGKITEDIINDKIRRLLRGAFLAGLFDNNDVADTNVLHSDEHKKLTLKAALEGITLLKNENNILPLQTSKYKSIAIIGPNAAVARTGGGGSAYVTPYYSVSPLEGISKRVGDSIKITYALGDSMPRRHHNPIDSLYLFTPDKKEHGLMVEYFPNTNLEGKPIATKVNKRLRFDFRHGLPLKNVSKENFSVRWTGWLKPEKTGEYTLTTRSDDGVRLYIDDKLVINNWTQHGPETDNYIMKLEAAKEYKVKLEYYQTTGHAEIMLAWKNNDEKPADFKSEAVRAAASSEVAVVFVGSANFLETEGRDKDGLELPFKQAELIKAITKVNKNTIVVLNSGTPVTTSSWLKDVKGFVNMYYSGQETGNAIAAILFGDVNPSGKLPFSFIDDYSQSPAFKDYKNKNLQVPYSEGIFVGYRYLDKNKLNPTFPFGFGLSYTTFKYDSLKVKPLGGGKYEVSLTVTNTGKAKGDEVVQLYVSDLVCSVPRPERELKGFSRVSLLTGESKVVTMILNPRDFAFWDLQSKGWKIEPGEFDIQIGASSRDIRLQSKIKL